MKLYIRLVVVLLMLGLSACAGNSVKDKQDAKQSRQASMLNVQLASGYIKRRQYDVAKEKLLKAIKQDDTNIVAYTTMAILMDIVDEPDEAEAYYKTALNIDSKNPELQNNYGSFLCKHDKIPQAIAEFDKVIKNQFYETPEKAYANLGYCLLKAKKPDYKRAEKYLREALKIQPRLPSALLSMAELGIKTHRPLLARAFTQRLHAIARPTAKSLWLQIQAENLLDDRKHFLQLSRQLLKQFPDSPEAEQLLKLTKK